MRVMRWIILACGLLMPARASAYVRTLTELDQPMYWTHTCHTLYIYVGTPPQKLATGQFAGAVKTSAGAWTHEALGCTAVTFDIVLLAGAEGPVEAEGDNRIMFRHTEWCRDPDKAMDCYDRNALAITSVWAEKSTGLVRDADMELNGVNFQWADLVAAPGGARTADLQNTLTHEFGHVLGFDHTCRPDDSYPSRKNDTGADIPLCKDASAEIKETTMYPTVTLSDTERRTLTADDIKAVCDLYPAGGSLPCEEPASGHGGCSVGRSSDVDAASTSLLLILTSGVLVAIRRRRNG